MAIVDTQLIISPVIRQYFTDPLTLLPVVGYVNFFQLDKITPKNVYQQTGDIDNTFEVAANPVVLDAAGAIPFVLYLYPFDEADATIEELYYVEVRRTADDSLVFALDDFPQNFDQSGGGTTETDITNLCPSYGFDLPVFFNFYTEDNEMAVPAAADFSTNTQDGVIPASGWIWQATDFTATEFYYEFTEIPFGTLDGNPLYKLNFKAVNSGVAQVYNYFGFVVSTGIELIGKTITYQFFAQDASTIPVTSLNVGIVVDEGTFINVGSITLDNSLSLRTLTFTMPDISASFTDDNQYAYLCIDLPLNQDYSIDFTGQYCYIGSDETIARLPGNKGLTQSQQFFANNNGNIVTPDQDYLESAQPLTFKKGKLNYLDRVGHIFPTSKTQNLINRSAVPISAETFLRGQVIGDTLMDRYIDDAVTKSIAQFASDTFIISSPVASAFDVETTNKVASYTPWISSTPNITIFDNGGTADHGLTSVINGGDPSQVDITFSANYLANIESFMFQFSGPIPPNDIDNAQSRVVNNMIGTYSLGPSIVEPDFNINSNCTITNVAPGSAGTPGECTILFGAGFTTNTIKTAVQPAGYLESGGTAYINYFAYLDFATASQSPSLMTDPPPFAIQFHVDSDGVDLQGVTNPVLTVNLDSSQLSDSTYIASQLNTAINNVGNYTITVNALPSNGDTIQASTTNTSFVFVFHDTAQAKPTNPFPSLHPIFIEFTSSTTTDDLATTISTSFQDDIKGIPSLSDFVDSSGTGLPGLPSTLAYYMYI